MAVTINGTTGVAVPLGTAAALGVVNTTSATTGIYNPTSTTLALSTNGTQAVYVDASQNMGIGTSSPDYKLTIQSSDAAISLKDSGGTTRAYIGVGGAFGSAPTGALRLRSDQGGLVYGYAGTEQMRIDTNGNLMVGTTSAFGKLSVVSSGGTTFVTKNSASGGYAYEAYVANNSGTYYFDFFGRVDTGANLGSISSNGTTMTYAATSDVRLKENIVDAPSALPTLAALQVRSFDWKTGPHHKFGFIAQEVFEVDPNAIAKGQTEDDMWGIDTSVLVPMLIKAVQELTAKNDALEARLAALESK